MAIPLRHCRPISISGRGHRSSRLWRFTLFATSALLLIHLIMDSEQNSTQDVDDADLVELYETWLKQQPAGTVPDRENVLYRAYKMMGKFQKEQQKQLANETAYLLCRKCNRD